MSGVQTLSDASLEDAASSGTASSIGSGSSKMVILFTADWHEACAVGGPMDQLVTALASSMVNESSLQFGQCNAEDNPLLATKYQVTAVPTFVLVHDGSVVERIVGGDDAAVVTQAVQRLAARTSTETIGTNVAALTPSETLTQRLDRLIRTAPVMIFIKGTPVQPKCGFSRQVVELLQQEEVPFASFDILSDESVRQGLKAHSDWPTYPQVYANGELIGGLDIIRELQEEGPLSEQWSIPKIASMSALGTASGAPSLEDRLRALVHRSPVMLFMKGLPSAPQCGFSRQIVQLLQDTGVSYDAFDILSDEQVRQGLKTYSDWPTFPQLYVGGDLIGGLDIVQEMSEDGTLADALVPDASK